MIGKLALRNLARNRWRTVLTMAGIAVGVTILVWTNGYMLAFQDEMIRGATAVELGQIQVTTPAYADQPSARHTFDSSDELIAAIEATEGVEAASPRVAVFGLVGNEDRSSVSRIVGVYPDRERAATVVAEGLQEGEWLPAASPEYPAPRPVVVGEKLARKLKVGVDSELVAFFEAADGSLGNELLRVAGIVRTGNTLIDRQTVFMHIEDLRVAGALEGRAHQIALRVPEVSKSEVVTERLKANLNRKDLSIRDWKEVLPDIFKMVKMMENSDVVMYIFVYLIVAFGLFNAQRMSALERRREFAMMMAIGVTPRQLFWTVIVETLLIALVGALIGVAAGTALAYYHSVQGLDLTAFNSSDRDIDLQMMGISFSQLLYFRLTLGSVVRPVVALIPFALLCGIWPGLQAARVNITTAISGRN